jgi:hypothetical protein
VTRLEKVKIVLLVATLWGCHKQPAVAPAAPAEVADAQFLLKSISVVRPDLDSLRAEGRVDFSKKGRRIKFHAAILAKYADHFFVEAGGFGFSASQVTADSKKIKVYTPAKMLVWQGSGSTGLADLFGIQLNVGDWVKILLAQVPDTSGKVVDFSRSDGIAKLKMDNGRHVSTFTVEEKTGWVRTIEYPTMNKFKITFGKPIVTPNGSFPSEIRVESGEADLQISFKKVETNPGLSDSVFILNIPPEIPVHPMNSADEILGE